MAKQPYPKEPCPKCGKLVSLHHLAQANHEKNAHSQPEQEPTVTEATKTAPAVQPGIKMDEIKDPKLRDRMKRALEVQERFRTSPQMFVSADTSDPFMEARQVYLPDSIPVTDPVTGREIRKPKVHEFCCEEKDIDQYVGRGYMPVLNEKSDHLVMPNGMAMMWCPQDMHELRVNKARAKSRKLAHQSAKAMPESNVTAGADAGAGGFIEEENKTEVMQTEELTNG